MSFAQSGFAQFMSSAAGRIARIVAGLVLIGWGYSMSGETLGLVLMVVGVVPLVAGALDLCFISALLGGPMAGSAIRAAKKQG